MGVGAVVDGAGTRTGVRRIPVWTLVVAVVVRRHGGGLLLPAVLHGLWDFSLISTSVVPGRGYVGPAFDIIGLVVILIVLLVRRNHIEPDG
jgi:hypothetical protein